jgi:hypothetical protein
MISLRKREGAVIRVQPVDGFLIRWMAPQTMPTDIHVFAFLLLLNMTEKLSGARFMTPYRRSFFQQKQVRVLF